MPPATRSGPGDDSSVRVPASDQARPARFLRASSDQLAAHRLVIQPFAFFLAAPSLGIALRQQLVERIPWPWMRLDNEPAALHRQADLRSRPQVQDVEHCGRYGQHDRATHLTQVCCVHRTLQKLYFSITYSGLRAN